VTTLPYQLSVNGYAKDLFRVHSFKGTETLSEAYDFEVIVTVAATDDIEQGALGKSAVLTFHVGPEPRAFYGVIAAVRLVAVHHASRQIQYALRLVPRFWLLKRKRRTRIFQRKSVPEIVTSVLADAGIVTCFQLTRRYSQREYCTQYEETDYRFIRRILAEAGIYFYFLSGPPLPDAALLQNPSFGDAAVAALIPGDTIVCADDAACYPPIAGDDQAALAVSTAAALAPGSDGIATFASTYRNTKEAPALRYLQNDEARIATYDTITQFELRNAVRTNAATFRDYDPMRPLVRLQSTAVSTVPFPPSPAEAAAIAAAAAENAASAIALPTSSPAPTAPASAANTIATALGQTGLHEVYDHHAPFLFPKWNFANDEAPRILRQERRRASIARGESGCSDFSPGHRFTLQEHPASQLDGAYSLIRVEHRGKTRPEYGRDDDRNVYSCAFECVPAQITYPPRPQQRKSVQVALTATVVGPPGNDIHVDPLGQIKVQFHWDREAQYDDKSSCWIRVMQPWAGAGWGHQFIPRIGQEVVVIFEGGDPDKPMILGTLYNGTHPPPFALPADKTKSGIRTQSSPGGGGFNELSFDDAAGREQIYVHAQGNLNEVVGRNHTLLVRSDEFLRTLGSRLDTIEKNLAEMIKGDHTTTVEGNRLSVVTGNSDERVTGTRITRIEGKERHQVEKTADVDYGDDLTTRVKGSMTTLVGKADRKRSWVTHAQGTASLSGLDKLELRSEKELVLSVGKSSIRITADKVEILSSGVSAKGEGGSLSVENDGIAFQSKDRAQLQIAKKIVLETEGASLAMEKEVKIDGSRILLNSPQTATDKPPKEPEPPTKIELVDKENGQALAYQRFVVKLEDGTDSTGLTDKDGKAELDLKSSAKIVFPDLSMPGDRSAGAPQPYVVRQGDYLQKLAFSHGFDADTVWNDPKNAELKQKRKDSNQLVPGDILHFARPARDSHVLTKGTTNKYEAVVPTTTVRFVFENEAGPFAFEPYKIEGLGASVEGKTDGAGVLFIKAPIHVREVKVTFPKKRLVFPLHIGDMDPIDEPSGVCQRLEHLGYMLAHSDALSEEEAITREKEAIAAFQRAHGMTVTGKLDEATKTAIVQAHGS
jgi:type VI secretion system secreted protein VgrG